KTRHLRELLQDPNRPTAFSRCEMNLLFDFSRQLVTAETLDLLFALAEARGLRCRIDALLAGERVNVTENRAALHTALRNRSDRPVWLDGRPDGPGGGQD